jgi:hypothetical protein
MGPIAGRRAVRRAVPGHSEPNAEVARALGGQHCGGEREDEGERAEGHRIGAERRALDEVGAL